MPVDEAKERTSSAGTRNPKASLTGIHWAFTGTWTERSPDAPLPRVLPLSGVSFFGKKLGHLELVRAKADFKQNARLGYGTQ